jgi:hypothetical protein
LRGVEWGDIDGETQKQHKIYMHSWELEHERGGRGEEMGGDKEGGWRMQEKIRGRDGIAFDGVGPEQAKLLIFLDSHADEIRHPRAFADYVFGSLILHFFCVNFIN